MKKTVLSVRELCIDFGHNPPSRAVERLNFDLLEGETLAIVGESGSGKSVSSLSLTRLLGKSDQCRIQGEVLFGQKNLLSIQESELRKIRGDRMAYIFQDPSATMNPVRTIGDHIKEALRLAGQKKDQHRRAIDVLNSVHLDDQDTVLRAYPAELSGGMLQRIAIGIALIGHPEILIADEATSALDATTQLKILRLLKEVQSARGMSMLFITHNFGLLEAMADRVLVLQSGKLVEIGPVSQVLSDPKSEYTQHLLDCVPRL